MERKPHKVKAIYAGAGVAAAAGLLMGAAMKPDLGLDDRPAGPQTVAADAGRSSGPFDDGGFSYAAYGGKVPDYVLGTDFKAAQSLGPTEPAAPQPASPPEAQEDDVPPVTLTRADYGDEARPPVSYPSIDGGAAERMVVLPPSDPDEGGGGA